MKGFFPHLFETKVELTSAAPRVLISPLAYQKMRYYVELSPQEVGWLGTVSMVQSDYLIEDTLLPEQECGAAHTEITGEGLAKLASEILAKEGGSAFWNKIRFWGHSHCNMEVFASKQDEDQMKVFESMGLPFFVRGIFNKSQKAHFTIFDYERGFTIIDPEWQLFESENDDLRAQVEQELEGKVSSARVGFVQPSHSYWNWAQNQIPHVIDSSPHRRGHRRRG